MAMDPKIIKKTQDILGKVIKKPPLTEKLLGKPPFRFLHDVFMEVMKIHGTLKGLYTEAECNSANVTEKDAKLSFLQKTIDCLGLALGESLSVRPSKVVAGQEAHKTNELLQALGQVATKKIDTSDAVRKVLSGEKSVSKKSSKENKKENEPEDATPKDKTKLLEDKNKTEKNEGKIESSSKEQGYDKEQESERKGKSSHSRDREDKERKSSKSQDPEGREIKKESKESSKDRESKSGLEVLAEQENASKEIEKNAKEKQGSSKDRKDSSHTEREKKEQQGNSNEKDKRREKEKLETEVGTKEREGSSRGKRKEKIDTESALKEKEAPSRDREKRKEKIDAESASKEKEASSRDREKRKEGRSKERDKLKDIEETMDNQQKEGMTSSEKKIKQHEDNSEKVKNTEEVDGKKTKRDRRKKDIEENMDNSKDENARAMQRPASAKGPRLKQNQQDSDEDTSTPAVPVENIENAQKQPVQRLVRPSSARPAPPKVKKAEVVEEHARVNSKPLAPVIMDNKNDDEDEGFIVEEDPALGNIIDMNQSESNSDLITTQEHGSLVRKMLESKKQADTQNNTDKHVVFDGARKKEREIAEKEIDGLRASIQQLVRSAHPLGKIMDYIQEDIDSMQKELIMWKQENQKHELSLKAEQSITENEVEPLKLHLNDLEHEIAEMMNNISAVKSNILRNEEKIEDLILGISR